jgi:hypothetical protein
MSAANRRRGADAERQVVAFLREHGWPDARRYLAGDGRQPGDVDVWPGWAIEVKDRAGSAWPTWRKQAVMEAGGRAPVVVRRTRGVPDVGLWTAELPSHVYRRLAPNPIIRPDITTATFSYCPRTGCNWVRMTFGALCDLVREVPS